MECSDSIVLGVVHNGVRCQVGRVGVGGGEPKSSVRVRVRVRARRNG